MILTEQEIEQCWSKNSRADDYEKYSLREHVFRAARAIESALLAKLESLGDSDYEAFVPPDDVVRVAELEAVLRECREALVHCEGVFDEVRGYPITYDLTIEAIAKIDEVLHVKE